MKKTKNNTYYKVDGLVIPGLIMFAVLSAISLIPLIRFGYFIYIFIPILIIILSFAAYRITEIDFKTRKYREGYMIFGIRTGEWKTIFDFNYVSVVGKNMKAQHSRSLVILKNPTGSTDSYGVYEIRLFKTISQRIILCSYSSRSKAMETGKLVAEGLGSKLLDATQVPPKFIIE